MEIDKQQRLIDLEKTFKDAIFYGKETMTPEDFNSFFRVHTQLSMDILKDALKEANKDNLGPDDIRGVLEMFKHLSDKSSKKPDNPSFDKFDNSLVSLSFFCTISDGLATVIPEMVDTHPRAAHNLIDLLQDINWKIGTHVRVCLSAIGDIINEHDAKGEDLSD